MLQRENGTAMKSLLHKIDSPRPSAFLILDRSKSDLDTSVFRPEELRPPSQHPLNALRLEEWLWGRFAIKSLVHHEIGTPLSDVVVGTDGFKPVLLAPKSVTSSYHVSLSHKKNLIMAGFSIGCGIGVDIEVREKQTDHLRVIRRVCHESEWQSATEEKQIPFADFLLVLWCVKEACVKAGLVASVFQTITAPISVNVKNSAEKFLVLDISNSQLGFSHARAYLNSDFVAAVVIK